MSKQFRVVKIVITTGPAVAKGHNGKPYTNDRYPVGSVLAWDAKGECYCYAGPGGTMSWGSDMQVLYAQTKRSLQFYRDYWRHIGSEKEDGGAPAFRAIFDAPSRLFWQAQEK